MKPVIALYEYSGDSLKDWARAGYECYCFDIKHIEPRSFKIGKGVMHLRYGDLYSSSFYKDFVKEFSASPPIFIVGFPPCTDLSSAGAAHFEQKRKANPYFQIQAANKAIAIEKLAEYFGCKYMIENPVGVLSTLWRPPNYMFDPCDYGGYLPEDDVHPAYPNIIPPRDAYTKLTCIWSGGGFKMPVPKPVKPIFIERGGKKYSPQFVYAGGKSDRTKSIRSSSPRGFMRAVFEANQ